MFAARRVRKYFDVVGGSTGRRYRIRRGQVLNVEVLDSTRHRMRVLASYPRVIFRSGM
jgi:hypothetical protein